MGKQQGLGPGGFGMEGGSVGCLLVHGFTGAPPEMRLLGEYLNAQGLTISGPLLAGHGTSAEDLNHVRWQDWVATAEKALLELLGSCELVFIAGLSMGALVTAHLAVMYPEVGGIILYSPALKVANKLLSLAPLLRFFIKQFPTGADTDLTDPEASGRLWHYETYPVGGAAELLKLQRVVRAELQDVHVPAIIFYSTRDASIHPTSAQRTYDGLGCEDKELVTLHNSGHCITVDSERASVFARTYGFIAAHGSGVL
jgi:carboxylesterase